MKTILAIALGLAFLPNAALYAAQQKPPPKRVVSMNVCVDQYLIALADRGQVAALSNFARDPSLSFYAKNAAAWPISTIRRSRRRANIWMRR